MSKSLQHWKRQATLRQEIIIMERRRAARVEAKLTRTIEVLTASMIQMENDYDSINAEIKALTTTTGSR